MLPHLDGFFRTPTNVRQSALYSGISSFKVTLSSSLRERPFEE